MSLSDELRKAVLADGRTHRAIAAAADMNHVTLSRFMNGHYDLRSDAAEKLAKALGGAVKFVRVRRPRRSPG